MSSNHFITQDGKWVTISDDELYHWKYIKREKVGNSWRYFYNNEEYQAYKDAQSKEAESVGKASAALSAARTKEYETTKKAQEAAKNATGKEGEYELDDKRAMYRGKTGDDVKLAQEVLKDLGYDLGEFGENKDGLDGSFGPKTQAAVKAYQEKMGLKVDGSIGPETMAALKADADKMNKANREAKNLSKLADEASKNRAAIAKGYTEATQKTSNARKEYEQTAGAKVADFLNKHSDKIDKIDSWVSGLMSKKTTAKTTNKAEKTADKTVNKVKQTANETVDKVEKTVNKTVDNGRQAAAKTLENWAKKLRNG